MNTSIASGLRAGVVVLVLLPLAVSAAERRGAKANRPAPPGETIEMFAGMRDGDLNVRLIPKDEFESRVFIKNNTDKPLNVKLPEAFAGVPVLAQARGGALGGGNRGGAGGGGQNQGVGGGMGGMGMGGMGGGGGGMGMMNIPAEKEAQLKVATVCLEHGKKVPRAGIAYEIRPLERLNSRPEVRELMIAYGRNQMGARATQAAAWVLANDMTWQQMANKRIEHLDGRSEPWFSADEIRSAMQLAQHAVSEAERNKPKSPGEIEPPGEKLSLAD